MPALVMAGQITVLDGRGLTRAVKVVKTSAEVVVECVAGPCAELVLAQVDSGAAPLVPHVAAAELRFGNVSEGVWKIEAPKGAHPSISSVKILDSGR